MPLTRCWYTIIQTLFAKEARAYDVQPVYLDRRPSTPFWPQCGFNTRKCIAQVALTCVFMMSFRVVGRYDGVSTGVKSWEKFLRCGSSEPWLLPARPLLSFLIRINILFVFQAPFRIFAIFQKQSQSLLKPHPYWHVMLYLSKPTTTDMKPS